MINLFNKFQWSKILFCIGVMLSMITTYASENYRFLNTTSERIPELAYVLCIHKDADDYLWFGTYNGLVKYDGSGFQIFSNIDHENSISNSVIHAITEDSQGNLWIGTEHGLNKFNKQTNLFQSYTNSGSDMYSLSSTHIRTVYIENDSIIWLGMRGGGMSMFNTYTEKFVHYRASLDLHTLSSDDINCFYALNDSLFYVGTENGGLQSFNALNKEFTTYDFFKGKTISYILADNFNNLWVGVWDQGLFCKKYNEKSFSEVPLLEEKWTPKDFKEDADGNLWIATFGDGLIKYSINNNSYQQFLPIEQSDKSIIQERLWSLLIDNEQNIWVGSFGNGVSFYDKHSNKFPFEKTNLENPKTNIGTITSAAEDELGNVWLLTDGGLYQYNKTSETYNKWISPVGFRESIRRVFFDKSGYLWLGCTSSMVQLDIKTNNYRVYDFTQFAPPRQDYIVNYIEQDSEGNIWFAVYEGGLYKIAIDQIGIYNKKPLNIDDYVYYKDSVIIPSNIIWQIISTSNADIWITTNSGFCKLNKQNNKFESYSDIAHSSLYAKHPGIMWLGGLGSGLGKYEIGSKTTTYYSIKEGLNSEIVYGVTGDYDGNIWMLTQKGISKFNPLTKRFKNYDASDGIEDIRFSMNSNITLSDGEFFCYSKTGFTVFNPDKIKDNQNTPNVIISDIKLYNRSITYEFADSLNRRLEKPLTEVQTITIEHKDKMLTINFNAVFYSAPDNITYAYQLQGFDKEWNYTNAQQRNATYTNLEPGSYLFKVKASNADGVWSNSATDLEIIVVPPFWQQWYFKAIFFLLLSAVLYFLISIQNARMKKRYAFEEVKKEREIIRMRIDKLDKELEQKNSELTSKTLVLLHKNEKIKELKNIIDDTLNRVSKTSQPMVYALSRFIQKEFASDQYWDQFEHQFNMTHNNFIDRFKEKHPGVNHKDLKVCAYIRMDLSNQEIGNLLNVTLRGVEASRHRIRKKVKLERAIALNDYIRNF